MMDVVKDSLDNTTECSQLVHIVQNVHNVLSGTVLNTPPNINNVIPSQPCRPSLRKDDIDETSQAWLIGKLKPDLHPTVGCQLPTCGDVLKYFIYLNRGPMLNDNRDAVLKTVILKVESFWELAGIPTMPARSGQSKVKLAKLLSAYESLRKHKTRSTFPDNSAIFISSLEHLFDIAHAEAVNIITQDTCRTARMKTEDIGFLEDQRSRRIMELGTFDQTHYKKCERKQYRELKTVERAQKEQERKRGIPMTCSRTLDLEYADESDNHDGELSSDDEFNVRPKPAVKLAKMRSSGITVNLPCNPLASKTISTMADRLNLSASQRTGFIGAILAEGGVPLSSATLSKSSSWRAGRNVRKSVADNIKTTFIPPKHCALHWDGKLVPDISGEKKERLGILVSGVPTAEEGKVLGIPVIDSSKGADQAKVTFNLAQQWGLCDNVRALVFDTTASNTGWKIGACIQLETFLNKKLFMLACRHHVFERILCAVHKQLFGETSGPENIEFTEFRDSVWKTIITNNDFKKLQFRDRFLQTKKEEVINSLKQILSLPGKNNSVPRDDYRECGELMLMLLGTTPVRGAHWLKPGSAHHARWMPSILYPAKMFAFNTQAGYDRIKLEKSEALCKFNALFYVEKWLRSSAGADAPFNDLQLWHALHDYRKYDSAVADAAITALERHLWYLTEECAVFSLFFKSCR